MAKLYAEITSDKGGRVASKGGNKCIDIRLFTNTNTEAYRIQLHNDATILVIDSPTGERLLEY